MTTISIVRLFCWNLMNYVLLMLGLSVEMDTRVQHPPQTFIEKMAALGTKQALAAAPDITSAKAALMDIQLLLRGPSRDVYCARQFAKLSREYIACRKVLPVNPFGKWKQSMMADKDLATDVREHLQELGKFITADKLVDYLSREDVMDKHGLDKKISVRTARRYLNELGYRFKSEKKGQYSDGHKRDDVVYYREEIYLPTLKGFQDQSCIFDADGSITTPSLPPGARRTVIWYHDESIFYAHDRRRKSWYHKYDDVTPYKKNDGASYMVADYFSADFGWLRTRDGRLIARHAMRPGKNRDGYFSSADIEEQAIAACTTVNERWPEYDHVFIYDNTTTHRKWIPGALSAQSMPKSISGTRSGGKKNKKNPNPDPNFLVPVNKRNSDGSLMYDVHSNLLKENIQMTGACFADGTVQDLYFPSHAEKHAGKFKGMELLLEERQKKGDVGDMSEAELKKKNTECKSFKCTDPHVCYSTSPTSQLSSCVSRAPVSNTNALFFFCRSSTVNLIPLRWSGDTPSTYRRNAESLREDALERNTLSVLEQVPLKSMRRFVLRAHRFADAYCHGLDGSQAAWAARKNKGHRVLPREFLADMQAAGIVRGGNVHAGL
ncbi:hypothetical protein C8R43DRAFT_1092969 [Mycena crocata]|nr:hypothetical protein C8R43DRAFT_1092969 [Mycena crocata]